ncbi:MAG: glycosyltransferase family 4 protein [Prosthecobacter sp.]|jgi:UDP-glucose:(heptosyl)LPS alpha-1,3-glucosyltransferase|uniref:glycosyltransferase family 4 protein n=1 Tax=Prosthecobacter sp. TaxID=1965333 RepID=UPI0019E84CAE|nr:glycosyltransferase family 4 protein [Prosthecobacter sp.]MBE2284337.1 glycosyltransferase family 4 protein [Prosthecobacter sp.]
MKIALVHPQIIRATAVESFLIEFARRLSAAGHEITCVTSLTTPEIAASLPVRWELLPRLRGSAVMRMWHFNRLAPRAAVEAGVDVSVGFGRSCVQDIHRNGTGCHRLYGQSLPLWQRYSLRHLYELHLERRLYTGQETKHFVTSSRTVATQLQAIYGTAAERFHILPPPVESQLFKPAADRASVREALCRKLQTDPQQPVLLFISLSHRRRGLEPLLLAMKHVHATLWIAGKGLNAAQRDLIQRHGLTAKVRSVPVTTNLVELYQSADWFVHPTQYDAFSMTVLQSLACGLPGIVSVMDGAVDHIRHGENGFHLHHPQHPAELATAINTALALERPQWQALANTARETVTHLTWERHMREWTDVMDGLQASAAALSRHSAPFAF